MEHMLDAYLAFARGQGGEAAIDVNMRQFLEDIVDNARRRGHEISFSMQHDLTLPLRPNAMTRALSNLVENAGKHANCIELSLHHDKDIVRIRIDDDGPGIPEDKWQEAFRPFHRLDEGRNLDSGGVGLGLSVARDIVRGHGGDLTLDHSPLGGLRAEVKLPT
jgi:two-component system osmolarity sensor histidine kinase EnvZ